MSGATAARRPRTRWPSPLPWSPHRTPHDRSADTITAVSRRAGRRPPGRRVSAAGPGAQPLARAAGRRRAHHEWALSLGTTPDLQRRPGDGLGLDAGTSLVADGRGRGGPHTAAQCQGEIRGRPAERAVSRLRGVQPPHAEVRCASLAPERAGLARAEAPGDGGKPQHRARFVGRPPHASVHCAGGEQVHLVLQRHRGVGDGLLVTEVVDEKGRHDLAARRRCEHPQPEPMRAAIGSLKKAVVDHRLGAGGRCHVDGDPGAVLA